MTVAIVASLTIQKGKDAEFETVFAELTAKVRANEPGNLLYQLTKSRKDPNVYRVLELYTDQAAVDLHGKTDYFRAAGAKFGDVLAGRPDIELLDAV